MDAELEERKAALRSMFAQLISAEEERKERLARHIADIDGEEALEQDLLADDVARAASDPTAPERQA